MKIAGYIATFVGGVVLCYLFIVVMDGRNLYNTPRNVEEITLSVPTYLSFIGVMLTAVTVVLAALAIFIGIVAAFTFRDLSEKAEQAAQKRADEALSRERVKERIDEVAFGHIGRRSAEELSELFDPFDGAER